MKHLAIDVYWGPKKVPSWSCRYTEYRNGEHRNQLRLGTPLPGLTASDGPWEALRQVYVALALIRKGDSPR